MKFNRWVFEIGGVKKLARKLDIDEATVRSWLRKETTPRVKTMMRICKMSRGVLGVADIVEGTYTK